MSRLQFLTLTARVVMETAVVVALSVWGYHVGSGTTVSVALAVLVPVVGFGIWGAIDFHQFGSLGEPLRLIEELAISGLAALAWFAAGWHAAAWALAALSIGYHALVYAQGERLLAEREPSAG